MTPHRSSDTRSDDSIAPPTRRGFSVVEVLVALVVVAVGLLGMAGSAALALRTASAAARQQSAVQLATTRLAWLTASGCASVSDGATTSESSVHEEWTAGPAVAGMRSLSVRVEWRAPAGTRALTLSSAMPC